MDLFWIALVLLMAALTLGLIAVCDRSEPTP